MRVHDCGRRDTYSIVGTRVYGLLTKISASASNYSWSPQASCGRVSSWIGSVTDQSGGEGWLGRGIVEDVRGSELGPQGNTASRISGDNRKVGDDF